MANIIQFPAQVRVNHKTLLYKIQAFLRLVSGRLARKQIDPTEFFMVYADRKTGAWHYINLNFEPDRFARMVDMVIEDQRKHPNPRLDSGASPWDDD
jgi:hypothetical protein